jgi:hypothetical protein
MGIPYTALGQLPPHQMEMLSEFMTASFSQFGEDRVIQEYMARGEIPRIGKYIDIGAFHPVMWSNTFSLSALGWSGINIDANENSIEKFNKLRPTDTNICIGISDRVEMREYHILGFGASNTISTQHLESRKRAGEIHQGTTQTQCRPIMDVLLEVMPETESKKVDYINIDLEGMDGVVVEQLDWELFNPVVVSIEVHTRDIAALVENKIVKHMKDRSYQLEQFVGPTAFFHKV